ncbi:hypothetical protein FKG94_22675 [Exilibacterium tricleocarpae]|uniref:Uncharacterized protein n=1 Tax=Exilibacterium tricleocarpae TaxID=2591008 RepID=A0A545SXA8_9GAMM|nr:DUF6210 family protein [Exilibacterium tricleocarpae]TQV69602.1 hypothetical protein FKG94_22675 [Exilibacterium tricleocarpae]
MRVELLSLTQAALIIPDSTGVVYTNQVGGSECDSLEMEGSIVPIEYDIPLDNPKESLTDNLCGLFREGNPGVIDQDTAEKIQRLLNNSPFTSDVDINWKKLGASKESWLHVNLRGTLNGTVKGVSANEAVLTWPNSD